MKKKEKTYGPHERDSLNTRLKDLSTGSKEDGSPMPNPAEDPIVSNNISNVEFDYTEKE